MVRFTRPAPFSVEPRRRSAGAEGLEPSFSGLEAEILPLDDAPGNRTGGQGDRGELNPPPRLSQSRMLNHYNTITGNWGQRPQRKERELNPQGITAQPASNRPPSPNRVALPSVPRPGIE